MLKRSSSVIFAAMVLAACNGGATVGNAPLPGASIAPTASSSPSVKASASPGATSSSAPTASPAPTATATTVPLNVDGTPQLHHVFLIILETKPKTTPSVR